MDTLACVELGSIFMMMLLVMVLTFNESELVKATLWSALEPLLVISQPLKREKERPRITTKTSRAILVALVSFSILMPLMEPVVPVAFFVEHLAFHLFYLALESFVLSFEGFVAFSWAFFLIDGLAV